MAINLTAAVSKILAWFNSFVLEAERNFWRDVRTYLYTTPFYESILLITILIIRWCVAKVRRLVGAGVIQPVIRSRTVTIRVQGLRAVLDPHTASVKLHWLRPQVPGNISSYSVRFRQLDHYCRLGGPYTYKTVYAPESYLNITRESIQPLKRYEFQVKVNNHVSEWSTVCQYIGWYCRLHSCTRDRRVVKETICDFCSRSCAIEFGRRKAVCRFPGCDKPCNMDTYGVHKYCGRTHALEHQKMMRGAPQVIKAHRSQRPRIAHDGTATPPLTSPPQAAVPTPNPLGSSQSTPTLALSPQQPHDVSAPQQSVPPDQQCRLPGCTKRKYVEPNGRVHDFCGRTHANQFTSGQPQVTPGMRCKTPGCPRQNHLKNDGSGQYFDYCSITCRNNGLGPSASVPELGTTVENTCILPNCNRRKYTDPANGRVHDYCCRSHAYEASRHGIVVTDTITIFAISGQEFQRVSAIFTRTWAQRKGACPQLSFIFEIRNAGLKQRWIAYQGKLTIKTMEEYYHGTKLTCNITATQALCNDQKCGVCGISRGGLNRRCIKKNINYQRFGHGFYLAPNSSKCHDYTQGAQGFRAMLLCEVLPGNKYNLTKDDQSLTGPPTGFDSVYGKAGSNSVLNYDELVVYNPDCVMPRYVCVYQKDGIHKIAR